MIGKWKTRCGLIVEVTSSGHIKSANEESPFVGAYWFGHVIVHNPSPLKVPTYWNDDGRSTNHDLDLMNNIAGPGIFGERG